MSTKPIIWIFVSLGLQCSSPGGSETHTETDTDKCQGAACIAPADTDTDIDTHTDADTGTDADTDTDTDCMDEACLAPDTDTDSDTVPPDAQPPTDPVVDENGGTGNVTTYGSVSDPAPSTGGACNYGITQILNFAAINVNVASGDGLGQWNEGRICGQCAEVTARTATGEKTTVVRIVDKCPDAYCGIDLGGLPAQTLMGTQPGRYAGNWQFIPCDNHPDVSDGPPSIFVKEGSNPWWALIQVRNPPAAVRSISWTTAAGDITEFAYATEAENFYTVPEDLRILAETVTLTIQFDFDTVLTTQIRGTDLTVENGLYEI